MQHAQNYKAKMTFENAVRAVSIANVPERRDLPSFPRPRRPRWFPQELSSTAMNLTEVPPVWLGILVVMRWLSDGLCTF